MSARPHVCFASMSACLYACACVRSLCLCVCMSLCVSMCLYVCMLLFKPSCMLEDLGHQKVLYAPSTMLPTPWIAGHGVHLRRMSPTMLHPQLLLCVCERVEVLVFSAFLSRTSLPPSPLSLSLFFLSLSLSLFYRSPSTYTLSFSTAPRELTEVLKHKFRQVRTWECSRTKPTSSVPTSRGPARFCTERVRQRDGLQSSRCIAHASVLHA